MKSAGNFIHNSYEPTFADLFLQLDQKVIEIKEKMKKLQEKKNNAV